MCADKLTVEQEGRGGDEERTGIMIEILNSQRLKIEGVAERFAQTVKAIQWNINDLIREGNCYIHDVIENRDAPERKSKEFWPWVEPKLSKHLEKCLDIELVSQLQRAKQDGKEEKVNELFRVLTEHQFKERIQRLAGFFEPSAQAVGLDKDHLIQEARIKINEAIYKYKPEYKPGKRALPWTFWETVLRYHFINVIKKERRRCRDAQAPVNQSKVSVATPDKIAERKEKKRVVRETINRLPICARAKLAFELYYLEGKTMQEIAEMLGCSVATVHVDIRKAEEEFRKYFPKWYPEYL